MMKRIVGSVLVALFLPLVILGQATSSVSGIVSDPSGAVVPDAAVTITNVATQLSRATNTSGAGLYTFASMPPGDYRISAKKTGFPDTIINNVRLLVGTPATINVVFEKVANVGETITVDAQAVQINTQDATLGNNFTTKPILQLPFEGRNIVSLLSLQPGVTFIGDREDVAGDDRTGSVNGGKADQSNITLDGVDINNQQTRTAFSTAFRLPLDAVQEFRVTTTNANANAGRTSGAQVQLVSRSGTNEIHGALYHFLRNSATNANDFFNNSAVSPSTPKGVPLSKFNRNIFGGRIGGPIKKNRLFYFINLEGQEDRREESVVRSVPTATLRQGIVQYPRVNGTIATLSPDDVRRLVEPNGPGVNQAALALFRGYPLPNDVTVGDSLNISGYRFNAPIETSNRLYFVKLDGVLDKDAKHTASVRANLQNDSTSRLPQFPGQRPNSLTLDNSKGIALSLTSTLSPTLVNDFRLGFTRQGFDVIGPARGSVVTFRNISAPFSTARSFTRITPTYTISNDTTWTKNKHTVQFGFIARGIRNFRNTDQNSWNSAQGNRSWLVGSGNVLDRPIPDEDPNFRINLRDAVTAVLGLVTQGTANYNYDKSGNLLPEGQFIKRRFHGEEYELYLQDTWRISSSLTVTGGLRWSLMPPVYERDGFQVTATPRLSDWFNRRVAAANAGRSQAEAGKVSYVLSESAQGRPLYDFHKDNIAPRLSLAYSPQGNDKLSRFFFGGPGKTSIRLGAGMFYELFGQGLISSFDASAFGLTSRLTNPSGSLTLANTPRFTGFSNVPRQVLLPAPRGGFPAVAPETFTIINSLDDNLQAPYTINLNFSLSREFGSGWFAQGSYVGRLSRRSMASEDIATPTNIVDPASGIDYFSAATYLYRQAEAGRTVANVPPNAFWENMFPGLRNAFGPGTATANAFDLFAGPFGVGPDSTYGLFLLDTDGCDPCSRLGPYAFYNSQYSYLRTLRSIGFGDYHAMQWTIRKRFNNGDQFDVNYSWSKSIDLTSVSESNAPNEVIINPFSRRQYRAVSDYDLRHQINVNGVYNLPFGRNKRFLSGINGVGDAILGGWQVTGIYRQTSGLPTDIFSGGFWATNWNIPSNVVQIAPVEQGSFKNAPAPRGGSQGPNIFADPTAALRAFRFAYPGESGDRNNIRGGGLFNIDLGLGKNFKMPYNENHILQFRAEAFNVTNTPSFDPQSIASDFSTSSSFGKYSGLLTNPRVFQFTLRYDF
jgi:hypothetical protein